MFVSDPIIPDEISKPQCKCFKAAAEFIQQPHAMDGPDDYRLAHGKMATSLQGEAVDHAWVEEGDFVYEVSERHHLLYSKDEYYKKNKITHVRTYTVKEVIEFIDEYGHFGPWN
jgi:hypothetical protein